MYRVENKKMIYLFESLVLHRFNDLDDLNDYLNDKLNNYELQVKELCYKSYYDETDETDYEILCTIGNEKYDLYDLSIYYTKTRIGNNIIVEVGYENM